LQRHAVVCGRFAIAQDDAVFFFPFPRAFIFIFSVFWKYFEDFVELFFWIINTENILVVCAKIKGFQSLSDIVEQTYNDQEDNFV
jgi:hypothetical protein